MLGEGCLSNLIGPLFCTLKSLSFAFASALGPNLLLYPRYCNYTSNNLQIDGACQHATFVNNKIIKRETNETLLTGSPCNSENQTGPAL